jgi:hypothetical protein
MKPDVLFIMLSILALVPAGARCGERPPSTSAPPADAAPQARWENLKSLRKGQHVDVVQMDLKSFRGDFLDVSDEAIRIRVKKEERAIARDQIFRVSVRTAARRGRNALIGVAVGAGLGAAVGAGVLYGTGGSDFAGAIVGATTGIGAATGVGLGAAFPGYSTVYRAPRQKHRQKP